MSRYSPSVEPMYFDLGSALRAGADSFAHSRDRKTRDEWMAKQEARQIQQDADRKSESDFGQLQRRIELDRQGITLGAKPMDDTSVMRNAKLPTVGDGLRAQDASPFMNQLSQSLGQRFTETPAESPSLSQSVRGAHVKGEGQVPSVGDALRKGTANQYTSNLARQLLGGEPIGETRATRDLTAEPRYRQITGDFGGAYIDNTRTPEARARQAEASKQSDILSTLSSAGLTPEQAKLASLFPNLTPELLFPKEKPVSPYGPEALNFYRQKAQAEADIKARFASTKNPRQSVPSNPASKETYFNNIAWNAIQAAGGDPSKAAGMIVENPVTKDIFNHGMDSRHLLAAAQRWSERKQPGESGGNKYAAGARGHIQNTPSYQRSTPMVQNPTPPLDPSTDGIDLRGGTNPSLSQMWDEAAAELQAEGLSNEEIVRELGNRP